MPPRDIGNDPICDTVGVRHLAGISYEPVGRYVRSSGICGRNRDCAIVNIGANRLNSTLQTIGLYQSGSCAAEGIKAQHLRLQIRQHRHCKPHRWVERA
jgi:hypothetical protein